ncbi:MAG: hypothetical protein IID14_06705 [Candidatus Marinimicrobia bacterium]|nr:hypothetical protein [Candidatus Neomarinimicrobiota bacterium]
MTIKGLDRHLTENANIRGDDPFNDVRLRFFPRHWITDRLAVFGEILYDSGVNRGSPLRVNGAYLVINELFSQPWLSLKAGLIPSPFGNYSLRGTYFNLNPLIGVPLMWHHRTPLPNGMYATNTGLLANKRDGEVYMPIAYDACWDRGWELFGEAGKLEYSLALTEGTLSNPTESSNDGRQIIARLGLNPIMALRLGGSVARGSYLNSEAADSLYKRVEDFTATVLGLYAELKTGYLQLHSEWISSSWESPYISNDQRVSAFSGYLEGRYDVLPSLYVAARIDHFGYSNIDNPDSGRSEPWGDPLNRVEIGFGYRLAREALVKVVYQRSDYRSRSASDDPHVVALQLHMVF